MATAAFRSTTKRESIGRAGSTADESSSTNRTAAAAHRRSRSLSRFSRRLQPGEEYFATPGSKGRFVNKVRGGTEFDEIDLDDLANEFMESVNRGRSPVRGCDVKLTEKRGGGALDRRGRYEARRGEGFGDGKSSGFSSYGRGRSGFESVGRRRSVSVVRCPISDSESDRDHPHKSAGKFDMKRFSKGNGLMSSAQKPTTANKRTVHARSLSQKDFSKLRDGYSSQSSALTDDESRDARSSKNGSERTIRAVYAQKKAEHPIGENVNGELYEVMRKELRHVVEEIRMDLEQERANTKMSTLRSGDSMQSRTSYSREPGSAIKRNFTTKSNHSERHNEELTELLLEEQCSEEPSKKNTNVLGNPSRSRKRSNDRSRMSKELTDEAQKYLEDFLSNVEDTDISSIDEERSDSSSTLGGRNSMTHYARNEMFQTPLRSSPLPVEMDGVVLPWLQWETSNDASPLSCKKMEAPVTPKPLLWDATQDLISVQEQSSYPASSRGSCSPGAVNCPSTNTQENVGYNYKGPTSYQKPTLSATQRKPEFDADAYLKLKRDDDLLFEVWNQKNRISSGGMLLCSINL